MGKMAWIFCSVPFFYFFPRFYGLNVDFSRVLLYNLIQELIQNYVRKNVKKCKKKYE